MTVCTKCLRGDDLHAWCDGGEEGPGLWRILKGGPMSAPGHSEEGSAVKTAKTLCLGGQTFEVSIPIVKASTGVEAFATYRAYDGELWALPMSGIEDYANSLAAEIDGFTAAWESRSSDKLSDWVP